MESGEALSQHKQLLDEAKINVELVRRKLRGFSNFCVAQQNPQALNEVSIRTSANIPHLMQATKNELSKLNIEGVKYLLELIERKVDA